jgi:hypothetical protein
MLHKNLNPDERHAPHALEYADAATRVAATGFTTADLHKLALQLSDDTYWILTDVSPPAWSAVSGGGPHMHPWADMIDPPATYPPSAHTHAHNDTTSKQGGTTGEYYHLTQAEAASVGSITNKIDKIHLLSAPAAAYSKDVDLAVISQSSAEKKVTLSQLVTAGACRIESGVTHMNNLAHWLDHMWSAGSTNGCAITDNGDGTVTIAAGECLLRATNSYMGTMYMQPLAQTTLTVPDGVLSFAAITYVAGGPATLSIETDSTLINCRNKCHIYRFTREGNDIHIVDSRNQNTDANRQARVISHRTKTFVPDNGSAIVSASGMAIKCTAGNWWYAFHEQAQAAFDTTIAGTANENVFRRYHETSTPGVFTKADNVKLLINQYNNAGTLTNLAGNRYAVMWCYMIVATEPHLCIVVGKNSHSSIALAQAETAPSVIPASISGTGILIGRFVVGGGAASPVSVESAFTSQFSLSGASDHGSISGLGDDDHPQYAMSAPLVAAVTYNAGGTTTIPLDGGRTEHFTATAATGATTWAITGAPSAGKCGGFILDLTNGGSQTQTWTGIKQDGGVAPTLTTAGKDRLVFEWDGTQWLMGLAAKDWK